ncbi:FtsB family cell division protein [Janibacter limosus]|uniref:Septum formation initiator family protein n=1 Tax=Janibacter limosus TaxID=53458 RepID=A0A4P6MTX2_9MICO|nr:septum formation initiator family protein [Janibacter limosus]QBF45177.1 septum formation initiator family protein [Janibacter limosus]
MAGTPRRRPTRSSGQGATRRARTTRPAGRAGTRTPRPRTGAAARRAQQGRAVMTTRRWVVLGSLGLLLAVMLLPTGKSWYDQRQRLADLRQQVSAQEANVDTLSRERDLWGTDEYVEAQARKRLKFVMPGERSYTVIDPDGDGPSVDPQTGAVTAPSTQPWYEQISSSVESADDPASAR